MRYEFINTVDFPAHFDPNKEYTTEIVDVDLNHGVIKLKYIGGVYNPKDPQCLILVKEEIDYLIHPFVD